MKPSIIFRSILGVIGAATISVAPSFAQPSSVPTTSVPITSGNFDNTFDERSGGFGLGSGKVLTGYGPITFTTITGTGTTSSSSGAPVFLPRDGDTVRMIGSAKGSLSSTTVIGGSFTAPLTISAKVYLVLPSGIGNISSFYASGATGTIDLPQSLLTSLPGTTGTTGGTTGTTGGTTGTTGGTTGTTGGTTGTTGGTTGTTGGTTGTTGAANNSSVLARLSNGQVKQLLIALLRSDQETGRRRFRNSALGNSRIHGFVSSARFNISDGFDQ
jgi:hypothetical protein